MSKMIDLTGQRFGILTVIERTANNRKGVARWVCECDCGNTHIATGADLRSGHVKSCGCANRARLGIMSKTHGMRQTRMYNTWCNMKKRCCDKNFPRYNDYGGRGITVCDEWKDNFQAFYDWAMANGYRDDLTLDREDVNGNYCPENCRWVTQKEQANNMRSNHIIEYGGESHTLSEWSDILGISYTVLRQRLYRGWPIEKALTEPVKQRSAIRAVNK